MALLIKIGASLKDFDRQMRRATKEIQTVANKFTNVGSTLTRNITVPLMGMAVMAGKVGVAFESQMLRVQAISGATGEEISALESKARELGATTMYSATEAAEGLENYARAGFSVAESLDAIGPSVNLAIATGNDLADVTDIVASAIRGFGMDAKDTAKMTDLLASTTANSNTNLTDLGEAFNYVAPMAAALGYTAEDVAEELGHMANAGIKGSMAGTSLRTALTNLANPTAAAKSALKKLNVEVADAEGNMLPLDDVVSKLRTSFKDLSEEEQAQAASTIFGKRAMSGMLAVINATEDDINKLADATTNYNGTVQEQADIMQSGLKGTLLKLKSAAEEFAIAISEVLLPAFKELVEKVQTAVDWLNNLTPEQKESMLKFLGMAAALGPLLLIIGKGISLFGKLHGLIQIISTGAGIAGGALSGMVFPIIAIIAVVAGLIALFVHLFRTNEEFRDKVTGIWEQIKTMFSGVGEFFVALFEFLKGLWQNNFLNIQGITQAGFQFIIDILMAGIQFITDLFSVFTMMLKGDWQGAWEAIVNLLKNLWTNIKKIMKSGGDLVKNTWGVLLEAMVTKVKDRIEKIKQTFNDLKEKIKGILDKIKAMWKAFKLPTFSLKMSSRRFLGKTITFPTGFNINWMAEGGIFTKPTLLGGGNGVGEAGKEAVLPLSKLPGLLGLNQNGKNIIQVILNGEVIEEWMDDRLGSRTFGGY